MAKSAIEKYSEFLKLTEEYIERHPKAEDPRNHSFALGFNELVKILKEAGDRVIKFTEGDGEDEVSYFFE